MKNELTPKDQECGTPNRTRATGTCRAPVRHVFAPGDKVIIYRLALSSRPLIEGVATIVDPIPHASDLYRVRFDGERQQLLRLVHAGEWQRNPDGLLVALLAHWRAAINPEILGEFSADAPGTDPKQRRYSR